MKPRITLLTLGVDDLERAVAFYRDGLGWATEGIVGKQFDPEQFPPTHHSWLSDDLEWLRFGDGLPTFQQSRSGGV